MRKRLLNLEGSVEFLSENIKNLIETNGYHKILSLSYLKMGLVLAS